MPLVQGLHIENHWVGGSQLLQTKKSYFQESVSALGALDSSQHLLSTFIFHPGLRLEPPGDSHFPTISLHPLFFGFYPQPPPFPPGTSSNSILPLEEQFHSQSPSLILFRMQETCYHWTRLPSNQLRALISLLLGGFRVSQSSTACRRLYLLHTLIIRLPLSSLHPLPFSMLWMSFFVPVIFP